jgi:hypothetical protein
MLSKAFEKAALSGKTLRGHLFFASESHSHIFKQAPADVVEPVFEVDVFNFVRDQDFKFEFPWVVVFADMKTKLTELERISAFVKKLNKKLVVISTSPKLQKDASSLKAEIRVMTKEVYQHHVPTALFCVDLTSHEFPYFSLGALALGRPVVSDSALVYLGPTYGLFTFTEKALDEISRDALEMERAKLRRVALRMNGRFFKKQMLNFMKERLPSFLSAPQNFQ